MIGRMSLALVATTTPPSQEGFENARMDFGKHKGELMIQLPDSYLTWISRRKKGRLAYWAPLADKVLESRQLEPSERKNKQELEASFSLIESTDAEASVSQCKSLLSDDKESYLDSLVEKVDGGLHVNGEMNFYSSSAQGEIKHEQKFEKTLLEDTNGRASWSSCMEHEILADRQEYQVAVEERDSEYKYRASKPERLGDGEDQTLNMETSISTSQEDTTDSSEEYKWFKRDNEAPQVVPVSCKEESSSNEEYRWFKLDTQQTLHQQTNGDSRLTSLITRLDTDEDNSKARYSEFIKWCGDARAVEDGTFIHAHIMNSGKKNQRFLLNFLIEMYGKWGQVDHARDVFNTIQLKNTFSWNAMLDVYVRNGHARQAIDLFRLMDLEGSKPNKLTYIAVVDACTQASFSPEVKLLHGRMRDDGFGSDVFLITCLISIYGRCGCVLEAKSTFEDAPEKDVVTWTTILGALTRNREFDHALTLYNRMKLEGVKPSMHTLVTVLDACAGQRSISKGRALHAAAAEVGFECCSLVGASLVHMYGRCADLDAANSAFRKISIKDVCCWNTIIEAHLDNDRPVQALQLFEEMSPSVRPNVETFAAALEACGLSASSPEYGRWIHGRVAGCRLESEASVANALVEMYVRCGVVGEASVVFEKICVPSSGAFTAMICGSARQGKAGEAVTLLRRMQLEGLSPGYDAFMNVVSVCGGSNGMADVGWQQFILMRIDYGLAPAQGDREFLVELFMRASPGRIRPPIL